jgi:hypothetical protein
MTPRPKVIFVVERIIDCKRVNGERMFLLKWKDFPASENSWEPEANLQGAQHLIEEFFDEHGEPSTTSDDHLDSPASAPPQDPEPIDTPIPDPEPHQVPNPTSERVYSPNPDPESNQVPIHPVQLGRPLPVPIFHSAKPQSPVQGDPQPPTQEETHPQTPPPSPDAADGHEEEDREPEVQILKDTTVWLVSHPPWIVSSRFSRFVEDGDILTTVKSYRLEAEVTSGHRQVGSPVEVLQIAATPGGIVADVRLADGSVMGMSRDELLEKNADLYLDFFERSLMKRT